MKIEKLMPISSYLKFCKHHLANARSFSKTMVESFRRSKTEPVSNPWGFPSASYQAGRETLVRDSFYIWIFKGFVYVPKGMLERKGPYRETLTKDQISLLILEDYNNERKKFENLQRYYDPTSIAFSDYKENWNEVEDGKSGFVYVFMNPSNEGLVKIGKTSKNPVERANEISSPTGVPTPYIVIFQAVFQDCSEAETYVHSLLKEKRISPKREFFRVTPTEAIRAVLEAEKKFK